MPLNLDSPSDGNGGGQFYDKLRFNAQGGVWFMKNQDGETRFPTGFTCVFDMDSLQTGWSRYNGQYVDFVADPSLSEAAPVPQLGAEEEDKWKRAFKLLVFSNDTFGGTLEFMHQARTVTSAFNALYGEFEAKKDGDKLPVVKVDGDPEKVGDYYGPSWKVAKMIDRPAVLSAATPAAAPDAADGDEF